MNKQNEGQIAAIQHGAGPMLVLAGPGSGKTYVITHRILHLISECNIPPNNILVLTFTKAAALEMQTRARSLLSDCAYVQFGTFHSVFYQILCASKSYEHLALAGDKERLLYVQNLLKQRSAESAEQCLKEISYKKNDIRGTFQMSSEEFAWIYKEYEAWLKENRKLDFDDMIKMCHDRLLYNPNERKKWQEHFSYILIDEFQDINPLQYETVKLLCHNNNLFAVGDDDQSIYSFRGADPDIMKQFVYDYSASIIKLSYNYRSGQKIIEHAAAFIKHNRKRFSKEVVAIKEMEGEVLIEGTKERKEMLEYLSAEIEWYAKKYPDKHQAILTRTNGLLRQYQQFTGAERENLLWNDLSAYLLFINEGQKRRDFLSIMNKPVRYISRNLILEEVVDFSALNERLKDKPWIKERVDKLQTQTVFAQTLDLCGQLWYIWNAMGYETYVMEQYKHDEVMQKQIRQEFSLLIAVAQKCDTYQNLIGIMTTEEKKHQKNEISGRITVMTYHGAKGLEFDRVYLPDLNYGKVPHGRMLTVNELEEERRMFYVAMTRAKESLVLLYDQKQTVSPFLNELYYSVSSSDSNSSSNSQLSKYSSKASSTFSNSASSSI
ncbi:MAG: ATP-dependent helicase [Lachnospiraceae bacterium]|nr:ATP-dependent helicase [Lachnospiraceae bacterium]